MEFNPNVATPYSWKAGASVSSSERKSVKKSIGKQCAAFDCYNYQYNEDSSTSGISFFNSL